MLSEEYGVIGKTLGHYRVTASIGRGGMGEVYLAEDTKLGREVALKTLPADLAEDSDRRERFLNEARALAALNHPNIVTIFSLDEVDGHHFLCMELIRGKSLHEDIPEDGYEPARWFEIALPLAEALQAAHELGVVHRDLKPSNLMFHQDGRIKVLDFGLATFVAPGALQGSGDETVAVAGPLTAEGTILGTVPYMSPEQIEGKSADARSDLFSLGIILYEMATGERPFHGDSMAALMSSILRDVPAPVTHLAPAYPADVARILGRCLEKDPHRRFQTVRDVFNELDTLRLSPREAPAVVEPEPEPPVAAAPRKFDHDIFISYAQLDNEAQISGQQGWVSALHRSLEVRVGQLLGKKPIILRNRKPNGDESSSEAELDMIPESALLITVLSPRYLRSEWCNRELRRFLAAADDRPRWGSKFRVFKVVKTPIPVDKHPPEIQPLAPYEFYKTDPDTGRHRELDQVFGPDAQREYWARLDDLAHDIAGLLEKLESEDAESGADSSSSGRELPAPSTGAGKGTIYLAPTTHDLREEHDAVRRDLARHGYRILPDRPLPLVGEELDAAVREELAKSRMSIHLVGRNYGVVPEGALVSMVERQVDLAGERAGAGGFHQMLWIPAGVTAADERQVAVLDRLRSDFALVEGSDLLETSLEDLKTVIHQTLNPPSGSASERPEAAEASGDSAHRVYLVCDQRDEDATSALADYLFERGYEVTLPIFEGDEGEVREDHEENLRLCDGVILYYGAGNELWLRRKLREVQKIAGLGRTRAIRAKGIWVAPPADSQKSRLRSREAVVMAGGDRFTPAPLQPFLAALGSAS
jgi:serine/threonine protein kinase